MFDKIGFCRNSGDFECFNQVNSSKPTFMASVEAFCVTS